MADLKPNLVPQQSPTKGKQMVIVYLPITSDVDTLLSTFFVRRLNKAFRFKFKGSFLVTKSDLRH